MPNVVLQDDTGFADLLSPEMDTPYWEYDNARECPACGSPEFIPFGQAGLLLHFRCRHCGVVYNEPAPSNEEDFLDRIEE